MAEHDRDREAADDLQGGGDSGGPADAGTAGGREERDGGTAAGGGETVGAATPAEPAAGADGSTPAGGAAGTGGPAPAEAAGPDAAGATGAAGVERPPLDEEAAWAAIVAGYGEEPPDPPGARPFRPIENLALPEPPDADDERSGREQPEADRPAPATPLGSSVSFAPGVGPAGAGPRDYTLREPSDDDFDEDDEGHFVPPEPPPLPEADATAKFAWLGVVGGPVLLLVAVLLGWDMTWWLTTLCVGGFLGGVATLVARMNPGDDEDDDPGRGAVV